jgi:hypothetical protein
VSTRIQVAITLWHLTRDADAVLPVIAEGLARHPPGHRGPRHHRWQEPEAAMRAMSVLGPAARPLVPDLVPVTEEPAYCASALSTLLRTDPEGLGGISLDAVAARLAAIADGSYPLGSPRQAIAVLAQITARHPQLLTDATRERLRYAAERPARVIHAVQYSDQSHKIGQDEALRVEIRALLA